MMTDKIRYSTGRNGEYSELPLNSTTLILPDGAEFVIRYDHVRKGLEIIKSWGSVDDDDSMMIFPGVSNKILIK